WEDAVPRCCGLGCIVSAPAGPGGAQFLPHPHTVARRRQGGRDAWFLDTGPTVETCSIGDPFTTTRRTTRAAPHNRNNLVFRNRTTCTYHRRSSRADTIGDTSAPSLAACHIRRSTCASVHD